MKGFIVIVLLATLFGGSVFSQQITDNPLQEYRSGTSQQFILNKDRYSLLQKENNDGNLLPYGKLKPWQDSLKFPFPDTSKYLLYKTLPVDTLSVCDSIFRQKLFSDISKLKRQDDRYPYNMPVYSPKEYFPMLIHRPDTSVWFPSLNPALP